jgi:hypothetical protein
MYTYISIPIYLSIYLQARMPSRARRTRNMCGAVGAHGQAASVHHPKPPFGLRLPPVCRGIPGIVCRERPSAAITCSLTRWLRVCPTLTPSLTHAHRSLPPRPMLPSAPALACRVLHGAVRYRMQVGVCICGARRGTWWMYVCTHGVSASCACVCSPIRDERCQHQRLPGGLCQDHRRHDVPSRGGVSREEFQWLRTFLFSLLSERVLPPKQRRHRDIVCLHQRPPNRRRCP